MSKRYQIGAIDELKTAPKGYPKDHPRIDLLRRKGLMMSIDFGAPKWLHTKQAATKVRDVWRAAEPMNAWLDAHVGPTTDGAGGPLRLVHARVPSSGKVA